MRVILSNSIKEVFIECYIPSKDMYRVAENNIISGIQCSNTNPAKVVTFLPPLSPVFLSSSTPAHWQV